MVYEPELLSARARAALKDGSNQLFVSSASALEIAIKHRIGKLPFPDLVADYPAVIDRIRAETLAITTAHALLAGSMVNSHRDPFDRILVAQSILDELPLVSSDAVLTSFGIQRYW